jgi:hypothetical protein
MHSLHACTEGRNLTMKQKLWFAASALGVSCVALGGVAGALLAPTSTPKPEIDRANATIQLGGTLKSVTCTGEDKLPTGAKTPYITYSGSWSGSESQILPDATDYNLSGSLTVSGLSWTINLNTDRGVLSGKAVLTGPNTAGKTVTTYVGTLTVITQGNPDATSAPTTGRGWLVANFKLPDDGVSGPNDDYLYANVEFPSIGLGGATGAFGDDPGTINPPSVPDYSVVANTPPKSNQAC